VPIFHIAPKKTSQDDSANGHEQNRREIESLIYYEKSHKPKKILYRENWKVLEVYALLMVKHC
jgi:hypothetical protein